MASLIAPPASTRYPARTALRSATAAAHARVDAGFSAHDLATPAGYRRFLAAQAAAFLPAEAAVEHGGVERVIPDWPSRRRSHLLRADLAELDIVPMPLPRPALQAPAALCGAVYVLEGSRLGGAMLMRGVAGGLPTRFLGAAHPPGAWRALLERLDTVLADEPARAEAVAAAGAIFDLFARAAETTHG